jgi:hypothetical protein
LTPPTSTTESGSLINVSLDVSSIRLRRSFSVKENEIDNTININIEQPFISQEEHQQALQHPQHQSQQQQQQPQQPQQQQQQQHLIHHHVHLRPQSDISWDEDTSSISGYRESYSIQLASLETNGNRTDQAPPLASPDLPSTSSTTTNYIAFDGSSPECSMNSNGGEKVSTISQPHQYANLQPSLLMVFQTQDEDTLI